MAKRIPQDAFWLYYAMGDQRSYQKLANQLGCAKRSIVAKASKEKWQDKLVSMELDREEELKETVMGHLDEMNARHLSLARTLQEKARSFMRTMPIKSWRDAMKALALGISQERLIEGEPTERTERTVEEIIRHEYEQWMVVDGERKPVSKGPRRVRSEIPSEAS